MKRGAAVTIEHADRFLFLPKSAEAIPWLEESDTGRGGPALCSASPITTSNTIN